MSLCGASLKHQISHVQRGKPEPRMVSRKKKRSTKDTDERTCGSGWRGTLKQKFVCKMEGCVPKSPAKAVRRWLYNVPRTRIQEKCSSSYRESLPPRSSVDERQCSRTTSSPASSPMGCASPRPDG